MGFFSEWSGRTTCHGVSEIYESPNWVVRILWTLLTLACAGLTLWQMEELLRSYLEPPHYAEQISYESEVRPRFPNVTVCNSVRVHKERAEALGLTPLALEYVFMSLLATPDLWPGMIQDVNSPEYTNPFSLKQMTELGLAEWDAYYADPNTRIRDVKEIIAHISITCKEMLPVCQWMSVYFDCCKNAVEVFNYLGKCYVFNAPILREGFTYPSQTSQGPVGGMAILLNTAGHMGDPNIVSNVGKGFLVIPGFKPLSPMPAGSVSAGAGFKTNIGFTKQETSWKTADQRQKIQVFRPDCIDDSRLMILTAEHNLQTCMFDCMQIASRDYCDCVYVSEVRPETGFPFCNATTILVTCPFTYLLGTAGYKECIGLCKEPCYARATLNLAASSLPVVQSPFVAAAALQGSEYLGYSLNNTAFISVYSSDNFFLKRQRVEKTDVFGLISNIGGQLGLWLGCSLVTLIQFVYMVISYFCCNIRTPPDPPCDCKKDEPKRLKRVDPSQPLTSKAGLARY